MAKKRMFSLGVLETDAFMDMPLSAQALYFHLNLRADDDGFIGNPKRITRNIGASDDDLKLLIAKRFILAFDDGVIVIKHWRMHNAIKKDRYTKTNFIDDLKMLHIKENGSYSFDEINGIEEKPDAEPISDNQNSDGTQMENKWNTNGEQMEQTCSTGLGLGLGKGLVEERLDNYSSEPFPKDSEQAYADVEKIPLNDGTEWAMPIELYNEYVRLYPAVDVKREIAKMRRWSISNPTKKKTKRGITRFVNGWLENEQNNPWKKTKTVTGSNLDGIDIGE